MTGSSGATSSSATGNTSNARPDPFDCRQPTATTGLVGAFVDAGVLNSADVHISAALARLTGETDERVLLAAALTVRATRLGAVCLDLMTAPERIGPDSVNESAADDGTGGSWIAPQQDLNVLLPWPAAQDWPAVLRSSAMVSIQAGRSDARTDLPSASRSSAAGGVREEQPTAALRYVDGLLYLERYWHQQAIVLRELAARQRRKPPVVDPALLHSALEDLFGSAPDQPAQLGSELQRMAVQTAVTGWFSIICGGPGTGKTTTVARLIATAERVLEQPKVALAAPTGKAAARLFEAVQSELHALRRASEAADDSAADDSAGMPRSHPSPPRSPPSSPQAVTLHRLLGWQPGGTYRYHAGNRLPLDLVIVDEASMVSLTMMSRLLQALRPEAIVVLVGDPDQLASVEAGAVLGDLVARDDLADRVVRLTYNYRNSPAIAALAELIRRGDADSAITLLRQSAQEQPDIEFIDTDNIEPTVQPFGTPGPALTTLANDILAAARASVTAARNGDVTQALRASSRHRLLCAHRSGPYGVQTWSRIVDSWLSQDIVGLRGHGEWYIGRPLLVDANDYDNDLFNGDTGIVVAAAPGVIVGALESALHSASDRELPAEAPGGFAGRPVAGLVGAFDRGGNHIEVPVARLGAVQSLHAMTVHRAQGSQAQAITVILPPADSPLLTRELLYTAVTRAQDRVRIVGSEASVRAAIGRRIQRPSGLSGQSVTGPPESGDTESGDTESGDTESGDTESGDTVTG